MSTTTRRAFLQRTGLLTFGLGLLGAAACQPAASPAAPAATAKPATGAPASPATAAPAAAVVTPRSGGTLTWGQWDRNDALDPAAPSGASATEVIGNVLDTLVAM